MQRRNDHFVPQSWQKGFQGKTLPSGMLYYLPFDHDLRAIGDVQTRSIAELFCAPNYFCDYSGNFDETFRRYEGRFGEFRSAIRTAIRSNTAIPAEAARAIHPILITVAAGSPRAHYVARRYWKEQGAYRNIETIISFDGLRLDVPGTSPEDHLSAQRVNLAQDLDQLVRGWGGWRFSREYEANTFVLTDTVARVHIGSDGRPMAISAPLSHRILAFSGDAQAIDVLGRLDPIKYNMLSLALSRIGVASASKERINEIKECSASWLGLLN